MIVSGCAHLPSGRCCRGGGSSTIEGTLPLIERGKVDVIAPHDAPPADSTTHRYYALSAEECQCMAVRNSTIGSALYKERDTAQSRGHHKESANALRKQALTAAAGEAQNVSSGMAMQLYYSLAEGEARRDVLARARTELNDISAKIEQVRSQGLQLPFDPSEFDRREVEASSQEQQLDVLLMQGNHKLRGLLGLQTYDPEVRIWPTAPLRADYAPVDVEAEVQRGLSIRPEIQILRLMSSSVDTDTIGVIRSFLSASNGLMGAASVTKCPTITRILLPWVLSAEIDARRGQIRDRLARRQIEIAEQIREAAHTFNASLQQVGLAQVRIDSWDHRLSDLYMLQKTEGSTFADIAAAKLNRLDAEAKLVQSVADVERARARLREMTGELLWECAGGGMYCPPVAEPIAMPEPSPPSPPMAEVESREVEKIPAVVVSRRVMYDAGIVR
jgi:hypothetical protein